MQFNKYRILVVVSFDIFLSLLATFVSYSVRNEAIERVYVDNLYLINEYHAVTMSDVNVYLLNAFVFIPIFIFFGIYRSIIKYTTINSLLFIALSCFVCSIILLLLSSLTIQIESIKNIPRSIALAQPAIFCLMVIFTRIFAAYIFNADNTKKLSNAIIYGAGTAGLQLLNSTNQSNEFKVVAFIDDNDTKHSRTISGIKIYSPKKLEYLVNKNQVSDIIIAIPSLKSNQKIKLFSSLSNLSIKISFLPSISEIVKNKVSLSDIKPLDINDLLMRKIKIDDRGVKNKIQNKILLVTGGGGSIGSELCIQCIKFNPKTLIIIDNSEFNLFQIEKKIRKEIEENNININFYPILASIRDSKRMEFIFEKYKPEVIYHSAAYKHVSIMENNIYEAISNNVLGTYNICEIEKKYLVKSLIFVSSDKAVRPTNVMGASKRLAEKIVSSYSVTKTGNEDCIFSTVRFGNVIGSSGSVIPIFDEQIKNGGPVTVSHPEIERYFMTIKEAALLILQSYTISKGGETFVLKMGDPIKILDLARKMIELSGYNHDSKRIFPDKSTIKIIFKGLEKGEKLYEELLINNVASPTSNENILEAEEEKKDVQKIQLIIPQIKKFLDEKNDIKILELLKENVEGF